MKLLITFLALILLFSPLLCNNDIKNCPLEGDEINLQIKQNQITSCLSKALKYGWEKVINYLIEQKQQQYQEQFIQIFQDQIKRLEMVQQEIVLGTSVTSPILKWGQNQTHIFLSFKLAHRWDSPPCLYTQSQQSKLTSQNLFYDSICLVSHQKIHFKINLDLFKSVMSDLSRTKQFYTFEIKKDGVGTYSTILMKQQAQIWTFLTIQEIIYPTWHEIETRYPNQFRQYERKVAQYKLISEAKKKSNSVKASSTGGQL